MAKPLKPNTARKPPVPSDSHADIEDWMRSVMPEQAGRAPGWTGGSAR